MQIYIRDNVLGYVILLPLVNKGTQRTGLKKIISCLNTTHNSVVAFIIVSFMMISIVYKLCMYLRKQCINTLGQR